MKMKIEEGKLYQFCNCRILRHHKIIEEDLWVRNGKILNPEKLFFDEQRSADVQVDCCGAIICAGFIDIQINGGFGVDFSYEHSNVKEGIQKVASGILQHGVTSFYPTIITSPPNIYREILSKFVRTPGGPEGAAVLGVHLEGPFISRNKKGAHPVEFITDYQEGYSSVKEMYGDMSNVCLVTVAPELDLSTSVIQNLVKDGFKVSLGHSTANLSVAEAAIKEGASLVTHLFNAMSPFHHRDPGLLGILTTDKIPQGRTVYYGIIADGIHAHPAALRLAYRTHPKGMILVTDAIAAMGLKAGRRYSIGKQEVEVTEDRAFVAGTNILCGSVATIISCVKNLCEVTECSLVHALESASLHPAEAMGITGNKGTLNFNTDADFVMLGDNFEVWSTWIAGNCVYQNSSSPQFFTK